MLRMPSKASRINAQHVADVRRCEFMYLKNTPEAWLGSPEVYPFTLFGFLGSTSRHSINRKRVPLLL